MRDYLLSFLRLTKEIKPRFCYAYEVVIHLQTVKYWIDKMTEQPVPAQDIVNIKDGLALSPYFVCFFIYQEKLEMLTSE